MADPKATTAPKPQRAQAPVITDAQLDIVTAKVTSVRQYSRGDRQMVVATLSTGDIAHLSLGDFLAKGSSVAGLQGQTVVVKYHKEGNALLNGTTVTGKRSIVQDWAIQRSPAEQLLMKEIEATAIIKFNMEQAQADQTARGARNALLRELQASENPNPTGNPNP